MFTLIDAFVFVSFCWTLMISLEYLATTKCECCREIRERSLGKKFLRDWWRLNIVSAGICLLSVGLDLYLRWDGLWN
jgi:hypothetical protein